jgi:hypothetical protein
MPERTSHCFVESLQELNPTAIWASFFIPPAIAMMEAYNLKPFTWLITHENVDSAWFEAAGGEVTMEVDWLADTFPESRRLFQTLQRESIVEYAAVATAFLAMTKLVRKNIVEVTMRGGKADYFLDERKTLLEISGTESAELFASRHSEKVRQLRANPFGKDGYVFVCCFPDQKGRLSFHPFNAVSRGELL